MRKYHNKFTEVDGIVFHSKKEALRYQELLLLQDSGAITHLRRQVKYVLIPSQKDEKGKVIERECSYKADFVYFDIEANKTIVEDTKGFRTPEYKIKRKLMLYIHNIRIKEV
jgi:hypothetical protein